MRPNFINMQNNNSSHHTLTLAPINLWQLKNIFQQSQPLQLSPEVNQAIQKSYDYLQQRIAASDELVYGVNTGFGSLCNVRISPSELGELQHNLILSHACGTGELLDKSIARLIMLLKIKNLSLGYSAVQPATANLLLRLYNSDIVPVIYQQGSLGASGDLAPLAHLSLPLLGKGRVYYQNQIQETPAVFERENISPLQLQMKEGLALLNGTQFCLANGIYAYWEAARLLEFADVVAALSIDTFGCRLSPFHHLLQQIRPHQGQIKTAQNILNYLKDSPLQQTPRLAVQDPYSFRCVPQVHGASRDALAYAEKVLETELNSVTDNPTVFADEGEILSGGNFHAQPLALVLDFMAMALSELANISERRIYQLIGGQRELPPFLTQQAGLHSGMMILQYTAASIVSQNKQLCTPASVDSIVSCAGQEDHVSMAANAGTKLQKVVANVERVLAIEWLVANQALSLRNAPTADFIQQLHIKFRKVVPTLNEDRALYEDIEKSIQFVKNIQLIP